jgi:hypothetical protein
VASISPPIKPEKARRPSPEDRRASVRYLCAPATPGRVYLGEDVEFQRAWVQNLSLQGVGLLLTKPLNSDQPATIQLRSLHSEKNYCLAARAVHSTMDSGGGWIVGFQFLEPLSIADLDELL